MKNNWQVQINPEGNLTISAKGQTSQVNNLFGMQQFESGICIYAHYLRPVRLLLKDLFPNARIKDIPALKNIIKEEFCDNRSVNIFKRFLEQEQIPYRAYSNAA